MNFISRLFAESVISIRDGTAYCVKGRLMDRLLRDISSLAAETHVTEGEIRINKIGKVDFSKQIPANIHQKIRNIIAAH